LSLLLQLLLLLRFALRYGALELTDCIWGWSVVGHHTVIAVNIIMSKSCCTIFIACMFLSRTSNVSEKYKNVRTTVI